MRTEMTSCCFHEWSIKSLSLLANVESSVKMLISNFRLVAVLIILYRLLMVCHSEYCLKVGEQRIRDKLLRFCAFFPLFVALMSMLFLHSLRDNIFCNGREEVLRFDIIDFLKPVFYNEFVVQGPLHHPYSILLLFIGGYLYRFKYLLIHDI